MKFCSKSAVNPDIFRVFRLPKCEWWVISQGVANLYIRQFPRIEGDEVGFFKLSGVIFFLFLVVFTTHRTGSGYFVQAH